MSYVTQKQTGQPVAILGAIGIPAAFAGLLVIGLAVKAVIPTEPDDFGAVTITPTLPPPPPEPTAEPDTSPKTSPTLPDPYIPPIPNPIPTTGPLVNTTGELPPVGGDIYLGPIPGTDLGDGLGGVTPSMPTFDPIAAKPANDASRWVTDNDYRSSWIRRGYSGKASFSLEVSTSGRVTNCSITRSTGHSALDTATCSLIAKRARFDPAMDASGAPTAGVYTSSINWQLPN